MVYLPFCSWETYSFDLDPSRRLNHTSSLLTLVMMALQPPETQTRHNQQPFPARELGGAGWGFPAPPDTHLVGYSSFLLTLMACPRLYHWLS